MNNGYASGSVVVIVGVGILLGLLSAAQPSAPKILPVTGGGAVSAPPTPLSQPDAPLPANWPTSMDDLPLSFAAQHGITPTADRDVQFTAQQQASSATPVPQPTLPPSANGSFPPHFFPPSPPGPIWPGVVSGRVGFPSNFVPSQLACAFHVENNVKEQCADYSPGTSVNFAINLPPGTYFMASHLHAPYGDFPITYQAYYDEFVTCIQTSNSCPASLHKRYIPIVITTGHTVMNVFPIDWYAPH